MIRNAIVSDAAPSGAGPYSPAIRAGDFLFLSGIGALHPKTYEILGSTVAEQTHQTMKNITNILTAAGATLENVVKMDVYLQNPGDYEEFNETYEPYFKQPYPARLTVAAGQVWDMLIKIDCIAYLKEN